MQILQWLFKVSRDHNNTRAATTSPGTSNRALSAEEEAKVKDLIIFTRGGGCPSSREEDEEESKETLTVLLTREDSKTWLYSTLQSNHLRNLHRNPHFRPPHLSIENQLQYCELLRMGRNVDSAHVGCKVLPICNAALTTGSNRSDRSSDGSEKVDTHKSERRRRAVSRVKELLRWAAAAKSNRGGQKGWKVLYYRNRCTLKAPTADELSSSSSKISFRWDVGSCSTSSSAYSPLSQAPASSQNDLTWTKHPSNLSAAVPNAGVDSLVSRKTKECTRPGYWITTDSDFVVLEL